MADDDLARLDGLSTEGRLPEAAELDRLSTREQVALMAEQDRRAVAAVDEAGAQLAEVVDLVAGRLAAGGRLIYVGAGTSGRLALLDAAECGPTFGLEPGRVVAVMAGGDRALGRALERGEDDEESGRTDLAAHEPGPDDVVIGVAASGRTPYVLAALRLARSRGAVAVAIVNTAASPLTVEADLAVELLTGPEVISGSTRLKAGTAQKLALNAISTLAMVKLGRTLGDLMVDVRATNDKLRRRARRIVSEATGVDGAAADEALTAADGSVKLAVVMLLGGHDAAEAARLLTSVDGHVRRALDTGP
jgi:N-acetylmuramic acid 6-phosphate etherase